MAKPIHVATFKPGTPAGKAASRMLTAAISDIREHTAAALAGDVDGIHDMRVSVKRLREAMRLFRRLLPTKRRERVMPQVELLNDCLGAVRECDVLILDAEELGQELADDGGLLAVAMSAWRAERVKAFAHLLSVWSRMMSQGLFDALEEVAKRTGKRARSANRLAITRFAWESIREAKERVDDRLCQALATDDPRPLHRLRIAIKRLRYSIEPFRDVRPLLAQAFAVVTQAQELLGLTHDLDVLRERIAAHLAEVEDARLDAAEGVLRLLDVRRGERYVQSHEVIRIFGEPDFTRALMDAID